MPAGEGFLVSPQQERILGLAPEHRGFYARIGIQISGGLDLLRLQAALEELVDRHEMLRSTFFSQPGEVALQVVAESSSVPLRVVDLRGLQGPSSRSRVQDLSSRQVRVTPDLSRLPLPSTCLLAMPRQRWLLLVHLPSLCADSWSMGLLFEELVECYGTPLQLEPHEKPMPYTQVSAWQRQLLDLDEAAEERKFWAWFSVKETARFPLPFESTSSDGPLEPRIVLGEIPEEVSQQVLSCQELLGVGAEAVFLAAWRWLLGRLSGVEPLTIFRGCPCRAYEEVHATLGLFERFLPIGIEVEPDRSFGRLVSRLESKIEEGDDWQEYFDGRALGDPRELQAIGFSFVRVPPPSQAGSCKFSVNGLYAHIEPQKLSLRVLDTVGGFGFEILFDGTTWTAEDALLLGQRFERVLKEGASEPTRPARRLPILGLGERRQLLVEVNRTAKYFRFGEVLHLRFEEVARLRPDETAVQFEDRSLTYSQLDARANQVARHLLSLGVATDDLVGVALRRSEDLPVALLGVLKAGAAYLPLDPAYPEERLAVMAQDAAVPWLLTESAVDLGFWNEEKRAVLMDRDRLRLAREPEGPPVVPVGGRNLAYGIYTSGSTGRPKAALNSHAAVVNRLQWMQEEMQLEPGEGVLHKTPYSFDVSGWELFWPLLVGGRLVIARPDGHKDPAYLAELIRVQGVTTVHFVPPMLAAFLEEPNLSTSVAGLRRVVCSGEALASGLRDRAFEVLPGTLYNLYGPTEAAIDVTSWKCDRRRPRSPVPLGRPIANTRIFVLDSDGEPVAFGCPGMIHLAGICLARGYLHRAAQTAENFRPDSFSGLPGSRLYRTGDLGQWAKDGTLEFLGRVDGQLKLRGNRVEPGEVETALTRHQEIRQAVAEPYRDGFGETRLAAYVVPASSARHAAGTSEESLLDESSRLNDSGLRRFLGRILPDFFIPTSFVLLDQLPSLPNGKLDRSRLPAPQAERSNTLTLPDSREERILTAIWQEVLGVPVVSVHDDFLALGGDSIQAMQIVARAKGFGLDLVPSQLFGLSTVSELARAAGITRSSFEAEDPQWAPLTPIQSWFFDLQFAYPHHWNQAVSLEVSKELQASALEAALQELERSHDALRMRFRQVEGVWRQEPVPAAGAPPLAFLALDALREEDQQPAMEGLLEGLQGSLDLEKGPVRRAAWIRLGDGSERVTLVLHHLVVDGVSWRVLLEDLFQILQRGGSGPGEDLGLLRSRPASFLHWSLLAQEKAQSEEDLDDLAYWLGLDWSAVYPLPRDFEPEEDLVQDEEILEAGLDVDQTSALATALPQRLRCGVQEILLAGLSSALRQWSGQDSLLLSLESHGRHGAEGQLDVTRTVGWFTSIFPVILSLEEVTSTLDTLRAVKEQMKEVPQGGSSFGRLRYACDDENVRRSLSSLPRSEIVFNYLGKFDSLFSGEGPLIPIQGSAGPNRHLRNHRHFLLEVNSWVADGRLEIALNYNRKAHRQETAEALLEGIRGAFAELAEVGATTDRVTLGDFSDCGLTVEDLQRLVGKAGGMTEVEDIYPLSPSQEGMLLYLLLNGDPDQPPVGNELPFFNQLHCELRGALDRDSLRDSWQKAMNQHPALRSEIHWREVAHPIQLVRRNVAIAWRDLDWRTMSLEEQATLFHGFLEEERRRSFQLSRAPLIRLTLIRLTEDHCRFVLGYHHLILDGWSVSLLLKEAFGRYETAASGEEWMSQPTPSYRDFVSWVRQKDFGVARAFWQKALADFEGPTVLPTERAEGAARLSPHRSRRSLGEAATERLLQMARSCRVTPNTCLQGAWALVLHEQCGTEEITFGSVVSGRSTGYASTLGLFINALPVRSRVSPDEPAQDWLRRLQHEQVEQRRFECCSLEQIQSWAGIRRDTRLFHSLLVFENYPVEASLLKGRAGLRVTSLEAEESTNYPVALFVFPGDQIRLELDFDAARVDEFTASSLLRRLEEILVRLANGPDQPLASILGPSPEEKQVLLETWNRSQPLAAEEGAVHRLFEAQVAQDPAAAAILAPAFLMQSGSLSGPTSMRTWSYGKLNRRANQLAHELVARGIRPGDRVALHLNRSPEMIASLLGVLKCGATYVPLDLGWPLERCRFVLEQVQARQLLMSGSEGLEDSEWPVPVFDLDRESEYLTRRSVENPDVAVDPESLAYIIFTSGSKGAPKGVMVPNRGLADHTRAAARGFRLGSRDRILQFASLAFDASAEEIYPALTRGAALVLRDEVMLSSATSFWEACDRWGVTFVDLPTSYWHQLVEDAAAPEALPQTLRQVVIGGEAARQSSLGTWFHRYSDRVRLLNTYGPTETTVVVTRGELTPPVHGPGKTPLAVSIGRPLGHAQVFVLDRQLRPQAVGVPGELLVAGSGLARGYLDRPSLTAQAFIPHPFSSRPGARLYRTGDLVRWLPDGDLEYLKRLDRQIKVRGYRVEPGEIERALEVLPEVDEAVVMLLGEGKEPVLAAFVAGSDLGPDHLRKVLRERFPEFMVPLEWRILESMPRGAGGKVDRRRLLQVSTSSRPTGALTPPRNDTERAIAELFGEVLGEKRIGVFDSFFDLGGHSLLATRLLSHIREAFEIDLPLRVVFEAPTVAELAAEVAALILAQLEELDDEELEILN